MSVEETTSIAAGEYPSGLEASRVPQTSSLARGMVVLGLGMLSVTALTLLVTRMYADRYGSENLSAVLIFRLYGSVLLGIFALGMPIALQRNVAFLGAASRSAGTSALAGLSIGMGSFGIACLVSALFSERIAAFLEHAGSAAVWRAFMALAFTQAFGNMIALIQIARSRWAEASLVTASTMGVAPLASLLIFPHASLAAVFYWAAAIAGACTLPSFWGIWRWAFDQGFHDVAKSTGLLLRYGLPRALGNAAEPILDLMLPSLAILSGSGLLGAGALAIGLALLRPLNPVTGAMSLVLTPSAAKLAARGDLAAQASQTHRVAEWAFHIGMFATVQLVVWADVLVTLWLGPNHVTDFGAIRIVCLALLPTFFYASVRGIIDGENEQPVNTFNFFLSLGVMLVASAIASLLPARESVIALAYLISRIVLGYLTLRYVIRTHAPDLRKLRVGNTLALVVGLGLAAVAVRAYLPTQYATLALMVLAPVSFAGFVLILSALRTEWAQFLLSRIRTTLG